MIKTIAKTLTVYVTLIISAVLLLSATSMGDLPPPYVEVAPPPYVPPALAPMPPAAVQPMQLPIVLAPQAPQALQAPPVINNIINVIHNVSQLNIESFYVNRHYFQRYWLYFSTTQLQPLTSVTIYYCDRYHLYSWDIDFSKKRKKYKKIKVHQIGGAYLIKNRLLLDINIYSICLL